MKIIFVIGGARSGKSSFALQEASKAEGKRAFIATAETLDDEMKERIEKHRIRRGNEWVTYEEPIRLSDLLFKLKNEYNVMVLDCLTVWLSNLLIRDQISNPGDQTARESIDEFIDRLNTLSAKSVVNLFIVSNEVGTGIVPENKLARQFRDLAGILNQKVAETAEKVYLITAGIPLKIKDNNYRR